MPKRRRNRERPKVTRKQDIAQAMRARIEGQGLGRQGWMEGSKKFLKLIQEDVKDMVEPVIKTELR